MSIMKGVILAGGEGTRLRPVTLEVPKPLITIRKKPLINYNLELFDKFDVRDVKVIIRPSDRKDYDRWHAEYKGVFPNMNIALVEETQPMGTLGYLFHHLHSWMKGEDVFVMNGDDIFKGLDLNAMLASHRASGTPATVAIMKMERPDDYGTVLVSANRATHFMEKQANLPAGLVSAGIYLISSQALEHIKSGIPTDKKFLMFEKDMFPVLAKSGNLGAFVSEGTFYDCGTFERWEKAIREV